MYKKIWILDFEFRAPPGERQDPVCMVAREMLSGETLRLWQDELMRCPFETGPQVLFVAFFASAEIGCFLSLGWPIPERLLDLFPEHRCQTNGQKTRSGLLDALAFYGLATRSVAHKDAMRRRILEGGPWSESDKRDILSYCEEDVTDTETLLKHMWGTIDTPRALLRGRYMIAVARMEFQGVPIDTRTLELLSEKWEAIKLRLIHDTDTKYGVYDEKGSFRTALFEAYVEREGIPWPKTPNGLPRLDDDTFKTQARIFPQLRELKELRHVLGKLKLHDLAVGKDGRNRTLLSPFRSITGRNQPSSSKFVFGLAKFLRRLIKPPPGTALAYIDYCQQEFAIAAVLSGDANMLRAYIAADPYLEFAKLAGAVPRNATTRTHPSERSNFKQCVLAVQYGMGAKSLAHRIQQPEAYAQRLLDLHRSTFATFWEWSDAVLDHAMSVGHVETTLGWRLDTLAAAPNPRSIRNFPMQAGGAECLRLACCLLTEAGIKTCGPIHDAVLIEAPTEEIDATVARAREIMEQATREALGGLTIRTDAKIILYPDRYGDESDMWDRITGLARITQPGKLLGVSS